MLRIDHKRIFKDAGQGIKIAWNEEVNFRFHVAVAGAAIGLSWILNISRTEWAIVFVLIGMVMTAEVFNTALEELCDMLQPVHDPHAGKIKDLAAGAVFLASLSAIFVGLVIFLPKLADLF